MNKERQPLAGVHDETIYHVLTEKRGEQSWFDACNALEASLVKAGWKPPTGHLLAANPQPTLSELSEEQIERMCRAHDREDAAQKGEPSPWDRGRNDDEDYATFRAERIEAMRLAIRSLGGG